MGMGAAREVGRSTVIGAKGAVKGEEKEEEEGEGVSCFGGGGGGGGGGALAEEEAPLSSPSSPVATADIEDDDEVATAKLDRWSHSPSAATLEVMEGGGGCTKAERQVASKFDTL